MDIEDRIRTRIEAILINDARNQAEVAKVAADEELLESDPFSEDRNLYQRMINSYRSAVKEVNYLLEENVGFLSGFYQFVENVKDKADFEEICAQIVDCVLQNLGAEYCSLVFFDAPFEPEQLRLEGIREDWKFLRVHSKPELLGSEEFEQELLRMASDSWDDCVNLGDVYREPSLVKIDFPSMVRSLVCLPVTSSQRTIGLMIMTHSRPRFFNDNHIRVLKILASFASHLKLLTGRRPSEARRADPQEGPADVLSVALLEFQAKDSFGRWVTPHREIICRIRGRMFEQLAGRGSILFRAERDLLVLLPGITPENLHGVVFNLRNAFREWRSNQNQQLQSIRMSLGYASCEGEGDLDRILDVATHLMHPEADEDANLPRASSRR
jgi:hypothetical protein